jgi:hypothetical protein
MQLELIDKFKTLPDELIHYIVNYTDVVVYRHGKYMNRIDVDDERYALLCQIPRPIKIARNNYMLNLGKRKNNSCTYYSLGYCIQSNIRLYVYVIETGLDGFDKYTITKSYNEYIFDANNRWSSLVYYSM